VEPDREFLLRSGVDGRLAELAVAVDGNIRDGVLGVRTGDLSRLVGRPTTPLSDTLKQAALN
jgi:NAD(P)H dehydrogenase (quinone)